MRDLGAGSVRLRSDSTWTQAPSYPETDAKILHLLSPPPGVLIKACLTLSIKHPSKSTQCEL